MQRDTLTECRQYAAYPITMVGIFTPDYETRWDVEIQTVVGCAVTSHELVCTFASRAEAEAFVACEYGLVRQAIDNDDAHDGWWLS